MVCPPVPAILDLDPNDSSANLNEGQAETRSAGLIKSDSLPNAADRL